MTNIRKTINLSSGSRSAIVTATYPSYGFACLFALGILLYATIAHIGERDTFYTVLCLAFLSALIGIRIRRHRLSREYRNNLANMDNIIFYVEFAKNSFIFGYQGGIKVTIPYSSVINYKFGAQMLLIQAGTNIYRVDLQIFDTDEKVTIRSIFAGLEHLDQKKGFRAGLNKTL